MEYTLSIVKPDAMKRNLQEKILNMIEDSGLKIIAQKTVKLTMAQARNFYIVHKDRPFYDELCQSMIECPVSIQILAGKNAIKKYRDLMGATNPKDAATGTIRKKYALSIGENSVHGSDSKENAEYEITQLFSTQELAKTGIAKVLEIDARTKSFFKPMPFAKVKYMIIAFWLAAIFSIAPRFMGLGKPCALCLTQNLLYTALAACCFFGKWIPLMRKLAEFAAAAITITATYHMAIVYNLVPTPKVCLLNATLLQRVLGACNESSPLVVGASLGLSLIILWLVRKAK